VPGREPEREATGEERAPASVSRAKERKEPWGVVPLLAPPPSADAAATEPPFLAEEEEATAIGEDADAPPCDCDPSAAAAAALASAAAAAAAARAPGRQSHRSSDRPKLPPPTPGSVLLEKNAATPSGSFSSAPEPPTTRDLRDRRRATARAGEGCLRSERELERASEGVEVEVEVVVAPAPAAAFPPRAAASPLPFERASFRVDGAQPTVVVDVLEKGRFFYSGERKREKGGGGGGGRTKRSSPSSSNGTKKGPFPSFYWHNSLI